MSSLKREKGDSGIFTGLSLRLHYSPVLVYSLTVSHTADQIDVDLICLFAPTIIMIGMTDILHLSTVLKNIITFPSTILLRSKSLSARNYSENMQI